MLVVFVLAFLGPWDSRDPAGLREVGWALASGPGWLSSFVALFFLIPLACLLAVLWPSRRVSGAVYRGFLFGAGIPFLGLWVLSSVADRVPVDEWGFGLYGVALALALGAEFLPVGPPPARQYAKVFR